MTVVLLAGCVDVTPPWNKVTVQPGAGGGGGEEADGPLGSGGSVDTGAGGAIDLGGMVGAGGSSVIDASPAGKGGGADASIGGAGGVLGTGGAIIDVATTDTGLALGGAGGALDVPFAGTGGLSGTGGASVTGGVSGAGGAPGSGGTRASGGTRGSGGTTGSGGTRASGGTTGSGGTMGTGGTAVPDAGPDLGPDAGSSVDALVLLAGLVAYYPCDGAKTDGVTLPDMSGNGNDGTLMIAAPPDGGTPPSGSGYGFGSGMVGNALVLTPAGRGFVNLPTAVFAGATDMTIAVWIKVANTVDWQKVLDVGINANLYNPNTTGMVYMYLAPKIANNANAYFGIATSGVNGEQKLASAAPIGPSNGWTHLTVVLGSSAATMYVNGTQVSTSTSVKLRPKDLGAIDYAWLGRSQFTSNPTFDGAIDEFRVYNRALSAEEVQALYAFRGS